MTSEQELLLELLDKIPDERTRETVLKQLWDSLKKEIKEERKEVDILDITPITIDQVLNKKEEPAKEVTVQDLQFEINNLKAKVSELKREFKGDLLKVTVELAILKKGKQKGIVIQEPEVSTEEQVFLNTISKVPYHKWYTEVTLKVGDFMVTLPTLIDSGAYQNCIHEGIIPSKYFEKTTEVLRGANGVPLKINYKLFEAHICKDGICFVTSFLLVKNLSQAMVLGTPFITQLYPLEVSSDEISTIVLGRKIMFDFKKLVRAHKIQIISQEEEYTEINLKEKQIAFLKEEISYKRIEENLQDKTIQDRIVPTPREQQRRSVEVQRIVRVVYVREGVRDSRFGEVKIVFKGNNSFPFSPI